MTAEALDTFAGRFSPPEKAGRALRFRLRFKAGALLPYERVATCGLKPLLGHVDVRQVDGAAYYAGVETCGSVWACPVCAARISEGRRKDVEAVLNGHTEAGGTVWLAALTVPHHAFQRAKLLRQTVSKAWGRVIAGKPWLKWKARLGLAFVRALEVTHGQNGWHPHIHAVFLVKPGAAEADVWDFAEWLYVRWSRIVARLGLGECSRGAFDFQRAERIEAAGDYVAKWGAAEELTKANHKIGKGGRTPWQLLADADAGDRRAAKLFQEYALAFKGARQLCWSEGLKERYGVAEKSDEEVASEQPKENKLIGWVSRAVYARMVRRRLLARVLDVAEVGGWGAVVAFLSEKGVLDGDRTGNLGRDGPDAGGHEEGADPFARGFVHSGFKADGQAIAL